ncbi:hypothetical protein D3C81_1767580 [compost metagenome]
MAVIFDFDKYVVSAVERAQFHCSGFRFARSNPLFQRLDAMVHGVPQQMDQRVPDFIDHGPVEFSFGPDDDQIDFFVQRFGQIPNHPRETVEYGVDLNHPQLQDNVL